MDINMEKKKILIIDDDTDLAMITSDMLSGYGYETGHAINCETAYDMLTKNKFHLILLDINLPDGTGFEVCKELRRVSGVPVIFASARTNENDKIAGLEMGGDDYLEKPYSLKELLARVNALIRRTYGMKESGETYRFGNVTIDTGKRTVEKNGEAVKLALKEFDVLTYLCTHPNHAINKETLLHEVWGAFHEAELATVAVHIRWLREKLEDDPAHPKFIQTVWGVGYMLKTEGN